MAKYHVFLVDSADILRRKQLCGGCGCIQRATLRRTRRAVNAHLQTEYALLEPAPITVGRFREAVEAAIETFAKSEDENRILLVKALQSILAEERLPRGGSFYLSVTAASYKKQSLDDGVIDRKAVNLSYNLSVPVPDRRESTRTVRLTSLNEHFFILKVKRDASE